MKKWYLKIISAICACLFILHPLSVYVYADQDSSQTPLLDQKMIDAVRLNLQCGQIIRQGEDAIVAAYVVHQTEYDHILRVFAYIKYSIVSSNKDIPIEDFQIINVVAPFEIIFIEDDNQIKSYCGALFAPSKIDSGFDSEQQLNLEENLLYDLKQHASHETYKTVSEILESDTKFLDESWEKIIGKSLKDASQEEIVKGFNAVKNEVEKQYEKAENQYYKQIPSTGKY
ncbi:hypothetical protein [Marasmitruncus massiliensis]|uniref:hypothetical protein n=1 Tax=Marasmitruncus massiliensis TaxID=1944642 RepID=UPI000C7B79CE|nr:hypothetical protein [Marasmitruncus massiliensis]